MLYTRYFLAFTILLLSGCSTPITFISRQAAIDTAIKIAATSQPELGGATPEKIQADLITLSDVEKRFSVEHLGKDKLKPETMVWLVAMEGMWEGPSAPMPNASVLHSFYHSYAVILDASNGELVGRVVR